MEMKVTYWGNNLSLRLREIISDGATEYGATETIYDAAYMGVNDKWFARLDILCATKIPIPRILIYKRNEYGECDSMGYVPFPDYDKVSWLDEETYEDEVMDTMFDALKPFVEKEEENGMMIDILKLNAEIDKMINAQNEEIDKNKKLVEQNNRAVARELYEKLKPYGEAVLEIGWDSRLSFGEVLADDSYRNHTTKMMTNIVFLFYGSGRTEMYCKNADGYTWKPDVWSEGLTLDRVANGCRCGAVELESFAYWCKKVLARWDEAEKSFREQLLDSIRAKAEKANENYRQSQEAVKRSEGK